MDSLKQKISKTLHHIYRPNSTKNHQNISVQQENAWIQRFLDELMNKQYFQKVHNQTANVLTIIACHSNNEERYYTLLNNLQYLSFPNNDLVIVNSEGERFSDQVKEQVQPICKAFFEIPNDKYMDFGKWNYACRHVQDISTYHHIIFTNDSYFILGSIFPFVNKMLERNACFYGFVSSSEIRHHYQSYLFACRRDAVHLFNQFYISKKHLIHRYQDLIDHLELYLSDQFTEKDCFLPVQKMPTNAGKNICFHNDLLYRKLLSTHLFPLIKLRRLNMK